MLGSARKVVYKNLVTCINVCRYSWVRSLVYQDNIVELAKTSIQ